MTRYRARTVALTAFIVAVSCSSLCGQPPNEWYASEWQLWCIDVDGTNLRPLDITPGTRCGSPVWSPDGTRIVYDVSSTDGQQAQIAIVKADGSDRRLFGFGAIPSWSPDGKMIAFQGGGLNVMNADGTGREKLPGPAFALRWLPRGDFIASGSGPQLALFSLATGLTHFVSTGAFDTCHGYGISPDGRHFALGTPGNGLWIATMDDSWNSANSRQVVTTGDVYHTSWAPDGRRVVFAWRKTAKERTQLYTLDVDSGNQPELFPGIDTSRSNVNPSWSPDGKSIVFSLPGNPSLPRLPAGARTSIEAIDDLFQHE